MKKKIMISILLLAMLGGCDILARYPPLVALAIIYASVLEHIPAPTAGHATPGASPAREYRVGPVEDSMETYSLNLEYDPAFTFNGFGNVAGTNVGSYSMWDRMEVRQSTSPVLSLGMNDAFVDLDKSGTENTGFEPHIRFSLMPTGMLSFLTTIPTGGDFNTTVNARKFIDRGQLNLNAGLLVNPATPGTYRGTSTLTSVDPTSGSANDGIGAAPTVVTRTMDEIITSGVSASIFTDNTNFGAGHTMKTFVNIDNPGAATRADIYVAWLKPDGSLFFVSFNPAGQAIFVAGNVLNTTTWTPIVTNFQISAGLNLVNFLVFQHTFAALVDPLGLNTLFIGLATPGTFNFFMLDSSQFTVQ